MPTVVDINHSLLRDAMRGVPHVEDHDGDFIGSLDKDADVPYDVNWVINLHQPSQVVNFYAHGSRMIEDSEVGKAIMACNRWNAERRWPKVFVKKLDAGNKIVCQNSWDFEKGVHLELLQEYLKVSIALSWAFYKWLTAEYRL